jgi:hypothetical protein
MVYDCAPEFNERPLAEILAVGDDDLNRCVTSAR